MASDITAKLASRGDKGGAYSDGGEEVIAGQSDRVHGTTAPAGQCLVPVTRFGGELSGYLKDSTFRVRRPRADTTGQALIGASLRDHFQRRLVPAIVPF